MLRHPDQVEGTTFSADDSRLVTASDDGAARVWDVRITPLEQQIRWIEAAQFESLGSAERFQLGLLTPSHVRVWSPDRSRCDESAGAPYDPDRRAPGVSYEQIVGDVAIQACATAQNGSVGEPRWVYEHGRALLATGDIPAARHAFERAIDGGYRAARIDLGMLLTQVDVPQAIDTYERAWKDGVSIAAFELGHLYETGVSADGGKGPPKLAPDESLAWAWYQRGLSAAEPNALARFGERDAALALSQGLASSRSAHLMESFKYYAAAAERARSEDWPDDAWVSWRYRRASLARILARAGMMQQVGDAYVRGIRGQ